MKALSCTFAALAVSALRRDVRRCRIQLLRHALGHPAMLLTAHPASTAFLLVIPYAAAIAVCTALAVIFWRKSAKC